MLYIDKKKFILVNNDYIREISQIDIDLRFEIRCPILYENFQVRWSIANYYTLLYQRFRITLIIIYASRTLEHTLIKFTSVPLNPCFSDVTKNTEYTRIQRRDI